MIEWLEIFLAGSLLGGPYALLGAGLAVMRLVVPTTNVAFGAIGVGSAYGVHTLYTALDISPFFGVLLGLPLVFACGFVVLWITNARRTSSTEWLMTMLALAILIQFGLGELFSNTPIDISAGSWETYSIPITSSISIPALHLVGIFLAVPIIAGLNQYLQASFFGLQVRAVADSHAVSETLGLPVRKICSIAFGLAFVLALIGSFFLSARFDTAPTDSITRLIIAFQVMAIGGSSMWGMLLAGILLGVVHTAGATMGGADSGWGVLFGHILFLVFISLRPDGLYAKSREIES